MASNRTDEIHMQEALALAERGRGRTSPNPMVGAVVVAGGKVVGRGFHAKAGEPHGEAIALAEAGSLTRGGTLYCTLEPCCHHGRTPPCTAAVIASGVSRVVVGTEDPSEKVGGKGIAELRAAGLRVDVGCLRDQARRLNECFNTFHELKRPFVTIKWAMTLDGRTGTDSNHSRWISNEASRRYVHVLRAEHDAVLIGIGTILADDPMLNVRIEGYDGPQPRRIIVDGDLSIPRRARVLRERGGGEVIIVTTPHAREEAKKALEDEGARVVVLKGHQRLIGMAPLMEFLASEQILSVLSEGGRQIQTSLLRENLVDKVVAFVSPKLIGGKALRSPVEDLGFLNMDQSLNLLRPRWHPFDEDICLEGYLREV